MGFWLKLELHNLSENPVCILWCETTWNNVLTACVIIGLKLASDYIFCWFLLERKYQMRKPSRYALSVCSHSSRWTFTTYFNHDYFILPQGIQFIPQMDLFVILFNKERHLIDDLVKCPIGKGLVSILRS